MVVKSDKFYLNDFPLRAKKAIIVTSWDGHMMFLKQSLLRYKMSDAYVICSFDRTNVDMPKDIMDIPDSWVFKHRTYGAEKRNGWIWDIIYAGNIISGFNNIESVFTVNSDCIWEKPEHIDEMIKFLGKDCDMMSSSSNGAIHTCAVMYKGYIFNRFRNFLIDHLRINVPESYSPEYLLQKFVKSDNVKNMVPPYQAKFPKGHQYEGKVDHYSAYNQFSTWNNILGYRNLGGEHKWACLEHLQPVPINYIDMRVDENGIGKYFSSHEQNLFNYYLSNDRRWLYKYWAEGEDSYWNRRYYPLQYYGSESLYDDSQRSILGPPSERMDHFNRWKYNSYILKDDEYFEKWKDVIEGKK